MVVYSGLMAGVKGFPDAVKLGCLLCGTGLKGQSKVQIKNTYLSLFPVALFFYPSAAEMSAFLLNVMGLDGTLLVVLKVAKKISFFDRKLDSYFFLKS